jgi:hypothetical protein
MMSQTMFETFVHSFYVCCHSKSLSLYISGDIVGIVLDLGDGLVTQCNFMKDMAYLMLFLCLILQGEI